MEYTRNKRTPCLMSLVDHFFGSNMRPETRPVSKNKQGTRQPTVETPPVQAASVAKGPTASDAVAKPITGGDVEAPVE